MLKPLSYKDFDMLEGYIDAYYAKKLMFDEDHCAMRFKQLYNLHIDKEAMRKLMGVSRTTMVKWVDLYEKQYKLGKYDESKEHKLGSH